MLKNKFKLIVMLFTIIMFISTFSIASDEDLAATPYTDEESHTDETETTNTNTEDLDIYEGDLYLTGYNITMDKLVDGNVYLVGSNVSVTGQINGNLFICANSVTFDGGYVRYSAFICANTVSFTNETGCNDLYVICNNINVSFDSYVVRDGRIVADDVLFKGGVGRDLLVTTNTFNLGTEEDIAIIYGNLTYYSETELENISSIVQGEVTYNGIANTTTKNVILDKLLSLLMVLIYTLVIYLLLLWLAPKFVESTSKYVSVKAFIALGLGLAFLIAVPIIACILLCFVITIPISLAMLTIYGLILSIATAIVSIGITYAYKSKLGFDTKYMQFVLLALVSIVLWGLTLIPYVGGLIALLIILIGTGIVIMYPFRKKENKNTEITTE